MATCRGIWQKPRMSLIPDAWTLGSYEALLMNSDKILRAYMVPW